MAVLAVRTGLCGSGGGLKEWHDKLNNLKFYTDVHISKAVVVELGKRGVDIVHCEDVGMADVDDPTHLHYATSEARVMVTHDADFLALHDTWQAEGKSHGGIIHVHSQLQGEGSIGYIVKGLLEYYQLVESGAANVEEDFRDQRYFLT